MGAGRPLKFKTVKEIRNIKKDGEVFFIGDKLLFNDFHNEKQLVNLICDNLEDFTKRYLCDVVVEYSVEKPIKPQLRLSPRGRRVDIFIKGKEKNYIIEVKNAKNTTEIRSAIGQLLDYGREYLDPKKELILIANMFDINTAKTIQYYKLPIRYLIINKRQLLEFYGTEEEISR